MQFHIYSKETAGQADRHRHVFICQVTNRCDGSPHAVAVSALAVSTWLIFKGTLVPRQGTLCFDIVELAMGCVFRVTDAALCFKQICAEKASHFDTTVSQNDPQARDMQLSSLIQTYFTKRSFTFFFLLFFLHVLNQVTGHMSLDIRDTYERITMDTSTVTCCLCCVQNSEPAFY